MNTNPSSFGTWKAARRRQQGVVLLFSLIALAVMLIGAVALVSSFNTTLVSAGNISFKRDMQNQAERATAKVAKEFSITGSSLFTPLARASNIKLQNYSAVQLPTDAKGIPLILLASDTDFNSANFTSTLDIDTGSNIKIRYVVDRLCAPTSLGKIAQATEMGECVEGNGSVLGGMDQYHVDGDSANLGNPNRLISNGSGGLQSSGTAAGVKKPVVYRITARVKGPRNNNSYFQTTFSEPLP